MIKTEYGNIKFIFAIFLSLNFLSLILDNWLADCAREERIIRHFYCHRLKSTSAWSENCKPLRFKKYVSKFSQVWCRNSWFLFLQDWQESGFDMILFFFCFILTSQIQRPLHNTRKEPTWLASDFSDIEETVHHIRRVQMEKWEAFDLRMEGIGSSPRSLYGLATRAIIQHFKRCTYLHILGLNHINWPHTFQQTIP